MLKKDRFTTNFRALLWVSVFFLLIVADQASKARAEKVFLNDQFAFSLPLPLWAIYTVYAAVLAGAGAYFVRHFAKFDLRQRAGWLLVWAGALANVGERLVYGQVRDWIYLFNGVFNLADGYILMGVLVLLLNSHQAENPNPPHNP
jgi:lipoprotein signal peptidase